MIAITEVWFSSWCRPGEGVPPESHPRLMLRIQPAAPCSMPCSSLPAAAVAWDGEARLHQQEGLNVGGEVGACLQGPGTSLGDHLLGAAETNKSSQLLQTFLGVL